jgi:hypothetical protein
LFGESTGSSESEEETIADLAIGKRLKRQFSEKQIPAANVNVPSTQEVFADFVVDDNQDWYSSGSERERQLPTPENEREPTTPRYSDNEMDEESKSESFEVSSEGSVDAPPKKKPYVKKTKKNKSPNLKLQRVQPKEHRTVQRNKKVPRQCSLLMHL